MSASIVVKLPSRKKRNVQFERNVGAFLVTPGDVITEDSDYMRGHGVFFDKYFGIYYIVYRDNLT